ncbi:MAG: carbohydrate-binding family 6 protein [Candidatus Hodarchaeota archaeon]
MASPNLKTEIILNSNLPQVIFAAKAIESSFKARGKSTSIVELDGWKKSNESPCVVLKVVPRDGSLKPEGFSITKKANQIMVTGLDTGGVMYGGLDVAETIRSEGFEAVKHKTRNPYMQMRGTKFNIPLDVRTPSYSDMCDSAQKNIPEMWSMDFWKEYIDTLAEYRYNYVSLWNLHPFPSLVKVPEYPDVALDDVKRSISINQEYHSLSGVKLDAPHIMDELETVKRITIDEKIKFWKDVMVYGKSRNVNFYIITWNVFTYGTEGKYGITDKISNKNTIDYFRKSVEQLVLTYPDLAGIGVTTGENMPITPMQKENWIMDTYGKGVLDALKKQPGRKIRFIHRQHQAETKMVLKKMQPLIDHPDIDFIFSFKYAKAHVYSAIKQPYHESFVSDIRDKEVKTIWTLRNDDIYYFRWGAPDYVREFIKNIPYDVSQGYYYGSDGYIWGREFLQKEHKLPRQIEIKKHWFQWMLWGRMGYNPSLSNERLISMLQARYPGVNGSKLLEAWQRASMTYPRVTGFHWGALDFQWYIEGCRSNKSAASNESGFHDVNRFLILIPHEYSGVLSIGEYVEKRLEGKLPDKQTPLELADLIEKDVTRAEDIVEGFDSVKDKELRLTIDDIRIICAMGHYYAEKIRGSTWVAIADETNNKNDGIKAIEALSRAAEHYKNFVNLATTNHHNPLWTNRVGHVDWEKQVDDVMGDIEVE